MGTKNGRKQHTAEQKAKVVIAAIYQTPKEVYEGQTNGGIKTLCAA